MTQVQKHIERALAHLDRAADVLEERGLQAQSDIIDKAAGQIEDMKADLLEGL